MVFLCVFICQINAKTELALRYNDISPLENHHCAVAFDILKKDDCNITRNFTRDQFKMFRDGVIRLVNSYMSCKTSSFSSVFAFRKGIGCVAS